MSNIKEHGIFRPKTTQKVAYTGTSARTANPVGNFIQVVRLIATSACYVKEGTSTVTATTNDMYLPAGVAEYFIVSPGNYIAAIQVSAGGTLDVTECT